MLKTVVRYACVHVNCCACSSSTGMTEDTSGKPVDRTGEVYISHP